MSPVLVMFVVALLALGSGAGATYEIHKWAKRVDTGAVVQADNVVQAPQTNDLTGSLTLLNYSFVWMALPNAPGVISDRVIRHPVIGIWLAEDGTATLSIGDDSQWKAVPLGTVIPLDEQGIPLNWNTGSAPEGVPATVLRSTNLLDWEPVATLNAVTNGWIYFRDTEQDISTAQGFYRL